MMMTDKLTVQVQGQKFRLLPERAVFWEDTANLIIADPHFGKPSSFRHAGIPVPVGSTRSDLLRLTSLIVETGAKRLIVLGDFFHHRTGQCDRTMTQITEWRERHREMDFLIIRGNHDAHSAPPPEEWEVDFRVDAMELGPFLLCHEPMENAPGYVLCGHIHPSVTLRDGVGQPLRLPCFAFGENQGMLPAFGEFTGTFSIRRQDGLRIYAIAEGSVIAIP